MSRRHPFLLLCSLSFTLMATAAKADPDFRFPPGSPQDPADFQSKFQGCINQFVLAGGLAGTILSQLSQPNRAVVWISYAQGDSATANPNPGGDPTGRPLDLFWNSNQTGVYADGAPKVPCAVLLHELQHAARYFKGQECTGPPDYNPRAYVYDESMGARAENWWLFRRGLRQRQSYLAEPITVPLGRWTRWPASRTNPVPRAPRCDRCSGAIVMAANAACRRCTRFQQTGCVDFHGGIYSGGDHRRVANGSLRIIVGDSGYCQGRTPCAFTNCYVCPHLDTAFLKGLTVTAIATSGPDSIFARWGPGACRGQGPTCTFTARRPSCITAQFLLTNPTAPPQSLPTVPCPEDP